MGNKIRTAALPVFLALAFFGCQRQEKGFISNNMFYIENPFSIQQGVTATSAPLVGDGSTPPLTVQLLALRDSAGNDADSLLRTPRSITTFIDAITYQDSTLALLQAKLKDSLVMPFNINNLGGRLQFTAATTSVPTGQYVMDVAVSNVRGTRVLQNACTFNIGPLASYYGLYYNRVRYWYNGTGVGGANKEIINNNIIKIDYKPNAELSQVVYKFVDKNGKPFNPKAGEVSRWNVGFVAPIFEEYDPFYPAVYTDTTIEYQIPSYGLKFPYFHTVYAPDGSEWQDGNPAINPALCRYKIPPSANKQQQMLQSFTSIEFFASGQYTVTVTFPDIDRSY